MKASKEEIDAVIVNVIGSAMTQAVKHASGKRVIKPTAEGYRRILLQDLAARGWALTPKETP